MATQGLSARDHRPVPFYRDVRIIAIMAQIAFVILIGLLFWWLFSNMIAGLRAARIPLGFGFLRQTAGFALGEGIPFQPTDPYSRALLVGIVNTLRVAVLGIILATVLGIIIGVGRLSTNLLLRNVTNAYVTIFRNTPLLVQLLFWYLAVILKLPRVRDAIGIDGLFYVSQRGLAVAWPRGSDSFGAWTPWLWAALVLGIAAYIGRRWWLRRIDRPGSALPYALLAALAAGLIGALVVWALSGAFPLRIDQPELGGFNFRGGAALTPEFFGLLLGLTIYTAAFIAEIVRGGILAVSKGQREAAYSLGLTPGQTLRLVIFPQAMRVIVPPLTNQYLNLTKNSSLGYFIAFPELFYVATTINNQSGAAVQVVLIIMASYLTVSLLTSLLMNIYNARIRLVER
jgi:general L-amino acid transport system permease protein